MPLHLLSIDQLPLSDSQSSPLIVISAHDMFVSYTLVIRLLLDIICFSLIRLFSQNLPTPSVLEGSNMLGSFSNINLHAASLHGSLSRQLTLTSH